MKIGRRIEIDAVHTDCILAMTSRPMLRACVKVRVATKERFTWTESFLGTSPNGFSSFMWVLTQIKYLVLFRNKRTNTTNNTQSRTVNNSKKF